MYLKYSALFFFSFSPRVPSVSYVHYNTIFYPPTQNLFEKNQVFRGKKKYIYRYLERTISMASYYLFKHYKSSASIANTKHR